MVNTKKPNRKSAILVIRPPKGRSDRRVANGPIVGAEQILVQMQMAIKKPYQIGLHLLRHGLRKAAYI